ncbi:MAG: DNA/RNA non-specific endonuclease [Polaromonas sp.]|nr:DNA/RNA non-specific endonuclease [Polaromonas sp.]
MNSLRRLLLVAALFAPASPALAGLLDLAKDKAKDAIVAKAQERYAPQAPAVDLPPIRGAAFQGCESHFPSSQPVQFRAAQNLGLVPLCFDTFATLYSSVTKTPMVVVERLTKERLQDARDEARTDEFFADSRLPSQSRALLEDYAGSGFDRGHMAPAANQPNQVAMAQSFALSNIVPQDPHNNRKVWSKIESDVRKFARRANGSVFVYTGPIFQGGPAGTLGRSRVWIPTHLFKLVYDEAGARAWAYVLPNTAAAQIEPPMSYAAFKQVTGMDLIPSLRTP